MKRFFRIMVLAGMAAVWILASTSWTAQAVDNSTRPMSNKYKTTLYYGVITLRINHHNHISDRFFWDSTWSTKGNLQIKYDAQNSKDNKAWIFFERFREDYYEFQGADSNSINPCTDLLYTASAYSEPEDSKSIYFDPKAQQYYLEMNTGTPKYTSWGVIGTCTKGQTVDEKKIKVFTEIDSLFRAIDALRLEIYMTREGAMGGSCFLPTWEGLTYGTNTYTDVCHWSAFQKQLEEPEWRRKK